MHSHQTSQPSSPVLQKPIVQVALRILRQLRPHLAQPYIDAGNWNEFCITCGQLDLSWESENGGNSLRLITSEKMQQMASQYGFGRIDALIPDTHNIFNNSSVTAEYLNDHLFSVDETDFLINQSKWWCRNPDKWEVASLRYFPNQEYWQVEYMFGVKDGHLPHINCTLVEAGKLNEDNLMFSEVWSILMLTLLSLRIPPNDKHEVVPVTVVTFSGTTFRILQGLVDGEAGNVRINKSSIVPISMDKENATQQMMLIMRWLLAEPLGPSKQPIPGIPHNVYATKRITGDLAELQEQQNAVGSIRPWFLEQAQKHGSAIVQIFLGPFSRPTILLSDYREVYDILTHRDADFQRGKKAEVLKGILPHAFPSLESFDPRYKESKAIMRGLMTPSFLQNVSAPPVYRATVRLLELWKLKCHMSRGRPFDAAGDIFAFSFDAVLSAATGLADSGGDLSRQISILRAHEESRTFTTGDPPVDQPIIFPTADPSLERKALGTDEERLWKAFYMPSPRLYHWYNSFRPAVRDARRIMANYISSQIQNAILDIKKGREPRSALGYIIQHQIQDAERTGHSLVHDDPRIRDGIYGYLIAGHDTSVGSLLWLLNRLVTHREEQEKVRNNLRETYAAAWEERRLPTVSEMSKPATYLNAFIEEVLRINTPVVTITVSTRRDTTILGHQIPKDTPIFLNLTGPSLSVPSIPVEECLRSPTSQARGSRRENWDDSNPTKFCPNRWLRTTPEGKIIFDASSGPTLMFSAGRRGCWGKNLGYLELRIVLTLLLRTFDLCEIPDSLGSQEIYDSLVTAPKRCFLRLSEL
ncbi:hypothetical protein GQX73_g7966 [Xylaria multiplex]|uniref:Cytochrome P450 n=1 Tax=Xylaria multiplex TaxID=323545 RepID=A0A7C8MU67_9PEZI|nr:hypothetical protein GQX73_g7966 [Xylaria multiplex]